MTAGKMNPYPSRSGPNARRHRRRLDTPTPVPISASPFAAPEIAIPSAFPLWLTDPRRRTPARVRSDRLCWHSVAVVHGTGSHRARNSLSHSRLRGYCAIAYRRPRVIVQKAAKTPAGVLAALILSDEVTHSADRAASSGTLPSRQPPPHPFSPWHGLLLCRE